MAVLPSLTICPPAKAHQTLSDEPAFGRFRDKQPVSAEFDGEGFQSTGIAFDDYTRMSIHTRKQACGRRFKTPTWALDYRKLRALLICFFERRAGTKHSTAGTMQERLARAKKVIADRKPVLIATMDKLCAEFVACRSKDPDRARLLQSEIYNVDTQLRMVENGPAIVAQIVHLYYSVGIDSVGISQELQITPQHARQTLKKLHDCWFQMTGELPSRSLLFPGRSQHLLDIGGRCGGPEKFNRPT